MHLAELKTKNLAGANIEFAWQPSFLSTMQGKQNKALT